MIIKYYQILSKLAPPDAHLVIIKIIIVYQILSKLAPPNAHLVILI